MRIWHEQLIPSLCQKHLCAVWRESLGAYKIIMEDKKGYRNHPATQEFIHSSGYLRVRLLLVRHEMLVRGYHPKELPVYSIFSHSFEPIREWQSLDEQKAILKAKGCKCKI